MATAAKRVARPAPTAADIPSLAVPVEESPFAREELNDAMPETKSKPDTELIIAALTKAYATAGAALFLLSPADGIAITANAEDLAESWRYLLDNDPKVRRALKKAIQGSGWGAVISAHLAVAVAIAKNHPQGISHLIRPRAKQQVDNGDRSSVS